MGTRHLTAHVHFAPSDAILKREHIERFSYVLEKLFRYVFVICFISQWMKRTKQGLPNMEMALLDWPIVLQYDVTFLESSPASGLKFFQPSVRLTNQKPVRLYPSINQSNRSISVHLLPLLCSRLFIPRSYENRSNSGLPPN